MKLIFIWCVCGRQGTEVWVLGRVTRSGSGERGWKKALEFYSIPPHSTPPPPLVDCPYITDWPHWQSVGRRNPNGRESNDVWAASPRLSLPYPKSLSVPPSEDCRLPLPVQIHSKWSKSKLTREILVEWQTVVLGWLGTPHGLCDAFLTSHSIEELQLFQGDS